MTAPLESCANCNVCMAIRVAEEAAQGLRCQTCLTSFVKPYPVEGEIPGYCVPCGSVLHTRAAHPAGRYGTTEPYGEPWEAPASTQSDRNTNAG